MFGINRQTDVGVSNFNHRLIDLFLFAFLFVQIRTADASIVVVAAISVRIPVVQTCLDWIPPGNFSFSLYVYDFLSFSNLSFVLFFWGAAISEGMMAGRYTDEP